MPLYEIVCTHCGRQELYSGQCVSVEVAFCPTCGRPAPRNPMEHKGLPPFKTYWSEALSKDSFRPVRVDSREQERALCKACHCERVR